MPEREAPLAGIRVAECGTGILPAYAGKILASLGADVLKVEDLGGDPMRRMGPFAGGIPDRDASATFAYHHAGKRAISVDVRSEAGQALLRELAERADIVIHATQPGERWLDDAALAAAAEVNPGLIACDISGFGVEGPDSGNRSTDLIALAAGGMLLTTSSDPDDPERPPLRPYGELSQTHAAAHGVIAALGALHARLNHGRGQRIDVSAQEALAASLGVAYTAWTYSGQVPERHAGRGVRPWAHMATRDGHILIFTVEDTEFARLIDVLGGPEWGRWEVFETVAGRSEHWDVLKPLLAEEVAKWTVADLAAAARAQGVPLSPILEGGDLLTYPQLLARDAFEHVEVESRDQVSSFLAPKPPYRFTEWSQPAVRRAPRLGEHPAGVPEEWTPRAIEPVHGDLSAPPLAGIRVADLTWVFAGPYVTLQLAHLGAEVIKVESHTRPDVTRRLRPWADEIVGLNRSGYFNQYSQGKKSLALNLKAPGGLEILRELIDASDVLVSNMSPGTLDRLGLPDAELRERNPGLVSLWLSAFGETGPDRELVAYGPTIEPLSGLCALSGEIGGPPADLGLSYPDPNGGMHACAALLATLYRSRLTGRGDHIDTAMLEAQLATMPGGIIAAQLEGRQPARMGNRDPHMSPHGVFATAGSDEWVAIAVEDDARFAAFARVIGKPELAAHPRFATLEARRTNEDELEAIVAAWAAGTTREAAARALQAAGVAAWPVQTIREVTESPHLAARGFFRTYDLPDAGPRTHPAAPWQGSLSPMTAASGAPALGEHTDEVLTTVLGMRRDQIDALREGGVLD